ncbi:uncharacterized protein G2W53_003249 [Senna tora]|uniref:Uncharacterized protein n=1 Tax=Senna tora TaxID=362788 RepID=A0A834X9G6_9FABA|nr:uncharacterized protein G2W53_003249 [Senna tora]
MLLHAAALSTPTPAFVALILFLPHSHIWISVFNAAKAYESAAPRMDFNNRTA